MKDEYDHWRSLRRMRGVMTVNARELLGLLDALQTDRALVISIMQSDHNALWDELVRLSHNYLSAVKTLVDHTRNLMNRYSDGPIVSEYQARVRAIFESTSAPVLQKLRNYLLHYRIPPFGTSMELAGVPKLTVHLDRAIALEFDGWDTASRSYLERQPERIELVDLMTSYAAALDELYDWLDSQYAHLHGTERA